MHVLWVKPQDTDDRVREHLYTNSQPRSVFKQLATHQKYRDPCDESNFEILDWFPSPSRLKGNSQSLQWGKPNTTKKND